MINKIIAQNTKNRGKYIKNFYLCIYAKSQVFRKKAENLESQNTTGGGGRQVGATKKKEGISENIQPVKIKHKSRRYARWYNRRLNALKQE